MKVANQVCFECPYCGKTHSEQGACCGESGHLERKEVCPDCGDSTLSNLHGFTSCGTEAFYTQCPKCGYQGEPE